MAPGILSATSTDAVNGSQVFAVGSSFASALGGTSTFNPATGTVTAGLTVGTTTYASVQDALSQVNNTASLGWNTTTAATGTGTVVGTQVTNVAPGSTVTTTAGNNIAITQNGANLTIATNPNLVADSLSINGGPVIDSAGITLAAGDTLNMGGNTITNVAAGMNLTDAVNVGQLNSAVGSVAISFSGNSGGAVTRNSGQTLAIQGEATTTGTYSGGNIKTVADPTTGAVNIQVAEAPKFGTVTINDSGSGKITGVTVGTLSATSTDAVNGSQVFAVGSGTADALGGASTFNPQTGTVTAALTVGTATYSSVQDALSQVNNTASLGWNTTTAATGTGTVSGTQVANVAPGATVTMTAGNNIAITQNGANLTIATNPNLMAESLSINGGPEINSTGITMSSGTSLNMGGNAITNVAAGVNATDAVNVGQLDLGLTDVLKYTDARINALNFDLQKFNRDANGGAAAAMAMSQVPQAFEPGMGMMGVGVSTWQGQQAIAFGFSKASDNGRVVVKATGTYNTRGQGGAAAGVGFQF